MLSNISLNKSDSIALYMQLYEQIKNLIDLDQLKEDKLPSIRSLSALLSVNNITVINAYKLLEKEDYIYTIKGSGTFIKKTELKEETLLTEDGDMALMLSGIFPFLKNSIDFASASPTPEMFPIELFKQSLIDVLDRDGGSAFLYPEISGFLPLRESISKFLFENYSIEAQSDQILITSGGQQGLDIISKALIDQGDIIFVENPTYPGAYAAFKSRGAKIIGIPLEDDGINIEVLENYAKRYKPKFIYVMPNYQSPTTLCYSEDKKKELLRLSHEYNFYIIEDDFLTDLSFSEDKKIPLKAIDRKDKVVFIKSFSKIFMPGVRIGFMILPKSMFKTIMKAKHSSDISSSGYLQRAFDLYLRNGYWRNHIDNSRKFYEKRYRVMLEELTQLECYGFSFKAPDGGLSIWVKLPSNWDSIRFYEEASKREVALVPGNVFFTEEEPDVHYIRLSFSAVD
ncbi:MAG: PLP-dependent aminotransferase family protein, partial [Gudongella sp.]|nr:PLP-dependent aminotransferase family protein [Gudongella sp.]